MFKAETLSIILAFIGNSAINIALATQKIGIAVIPDKKWRGVAYWTIGVIGVLGGNFFILYAVKLGSVAIAGAMAGPGIASLAVFSFFVMKETITKKELAGIIVIFISAILLGVFTKEYSDSPIYLTRLYIFCIVIIVSYPLLMLFVLRKKKGGGVIGAFAGAVGGLVPLFQKVSTSSLGEASTFFTLNNVTGIKKEVLTLFINPYALLWIVISFVAFFIIQFAYKRGKAIHIIPVYSANYLLVPIVGGLICFGETFHLFQWVGFAGILVGLYLLTVKKGKVAAEER